MNQSWREQVRDGGKLVNLGRFATPEQAALFYARRRAGRDTTDLTYAYRSRAHRHPHTRAPPRAPHPGRERGLCFLRSMARELA